MSLSPDERLLQVFATGEAVTQRSLSRELGMALGLTNLLIKRLVSKGYIQVSRLRPRHVRYLLTAEGQQALSVMSLISLENTVTLYTQTRDRIRVALERLVEEAQPDEQLPLPVVFYGLGDVAEIAYVSLQFSQLSLVGAVDDFKAGTFFGLPIQAPAALAEANGRLARSRVIVTTVRRSDEIRDRLRALDIAPSRVFVLDSAMSQAHPLAGASPVRSSPICGVAPR